MENYNKAPNLSFNATYNLYKSSTDREVTETYGSLYCKKGNNFYLKINDTEYISNKNTGVKINHSERLIAVAKAGNLSKATNFLRVLSDFKPGTFKDRGAFWEIELLGKSFSNYPYGRVVIEISKNYTIRKQKFFFNTGMNFSEDFRKQDIRYPVLEVLFSAVTKKEVDPAQFDTSRFFSGPYNSFKVTPAYRGYKIIYIK